VVTFIILPTALCRLCFNKRQSRRGTLNPYDTLFKVYNTDNPRDMKAKSANKCRFATYTDAAVDILCEYIM